jgi:hypothetical protein
MRRARPDDFDLWQEPVQVRAAVAYLPGDGWIAVFEQQEEHHNTQARLDFESKRIRTREEVTFDPLRHKHQSSGDSRLKQIMKILDSFGVDRTREQRIFHKWFLRACLPHIYGYEWSANSTSILEQHGLAKLRSEVLIATPRRFGKTWAVAMFVTAFLLVVTNKTIAVFSKAQRQSKGLKDHVKEFMARLQGATDRIVEDNQEHLFVSSVAVTKNKLSGATHFRRGLKNSDMCKLYSFPGGTDGTFHPPLPPEGQGEKDSCVYLVARGG